MNTSPKPSTQRILSTQRRKTANALSPMLESYRRALVADQKRPHTIATRMDSACQFWEFADDDMPTRDAIRDWLVYMRERGLSAATIQIRWRGLRAYCRWLLDEDEIDRDPMAKMQMPPLDETHKDIVSTDDMSRALTQLEKAKRWRDYAAIAILYDTGLRASELCSARMEDLDMKTGTLFVANAKGRRVRVVHLSPQALRAVDRCHRHSQSDFVVFGQRGPLSTSGLRQVVGRVFRDAGVKAKIGPHDLRHTSASHVASARILSESEAMQLYGWKSPEMWRRYSEQVRQEAALKAHEQGSPLTRLLSDKTVPRNQRRGT